MCQSYRSATNEKCKMKKENYTPYIGSVESSVSVRNHKWKNKNGKLKIENGKWEMKNHKSHTGVIKGEVVIKIKKLQLEFMNTNPLILFLCTP